MPHLGERNGEKNKSQRIEVRQVTLEAARGYRKTLGLKRACYNWFPNSIWVLTRR